MIIQGGDCVIIIKVKLLQQIGRGILCLTKKRRIDKIKQMQAQRSKFNTNKPVVSPKLGRSQQLQTDYISYDAPPLDFSYKNITSLQQLKTIQPRQGQKYNAQQQAQRQQKQQCQIEKSEQQQTAKQQKKPQVMKLLPQNTISTVVNTLVNTSAMKNISTKAKEELEKKKKKAVNIKLVCCSIMLGYNKLRTLIQFPIAIKSVMSNWQQLQWIDLSHNYLMRLDYDFKDFPSLKTLYMHCNFIYLFDDLTQLAGLKELKNFTIHGNSLTAVGNFRLIVIGILPQLKKLDSVLISKKERDNAVFIKTQFKKFPQPKILLQPPTQKKPQQEEQKQ